MTNVDLCVQEYVLQRRKARENGEPPPHAPQAINGNEHNPGEKNNRVTAPTSSVNTPRKSWMEWFHIEDVS